MDTYNVELSDDLEPASLTAPGFRDERGGWGFYYLNLTRALMDLYRGRDSDCALLAVSCPARNAVVSGQTLPVAWSVVGHPASDFTIAIDGKPIKQNVESAAAEIALVGMAEGRHVLTVVANGAKTRYPLSWTELDAPLQNAIPVKVDVPFMIKAVPA